MPTYLREVHALPSYMVSQLINDKLNVNINKKLSLPVTDKKYGAFVASVYVNKQLHRHEGEALAVNRFRKSGPKKAVAWGSRSIIC